MHKTIKFGCMVAELHQNAIVSLNCSALQGMIGARSAHKPTFKKWPRDPEIVVRHAQYAWPLFEVHLLRQL